jgi:HAE1 family hydrophobic/amphiphilic exporter-1
VDNSIVVLEAIQRQRDRGLDERAAAETGTGEVASAVIASTLTTICVFVPIVFVEGIAGQLFGDQALTVTYSLSVSLLVALTIIPMLASRDHRSRSSSNAKTDEAQRTDADRRGSASTKRTAFSTTVAVARSFRHLGRLAGSVVAAVTSAPLRLFQSGFDRLASLYQYILPKVLGRPILTVLIALALLLGSLTLVPTLGRELVPELIQGEFFVNAELPPGTHLDVTERRLASLERFVAPLEDVRTVYAIAGSSNEQGGVAGETRENIGQLTLVLEPPISRDREETLMSGLREALDTQEGLEYRFGRPSYFSFRTPIEIEIRGYNLELLKRLAETLVVEMESIPGLTDIKSSTEGGSPELQVNFDRNRLAKYQLTLGEVADLLRSKVQGIVATDIQRQDRQVDIRVRSEESFRDSVSDLLSLTIYQEGKTAIPLSAVATVDEIEGPAEIRRAEGERVAVITANLVGSDLGTVSQAIALKLEAMQMPSGFDWEIGGQRQEMETSFNSMRLAILLAIFMVYLVMASQFESLLHPFVILFSVPFALIGVLGTLALFNVRISIVVLIGTILLAGIVVNNAILLIDATNRLRRDGKTKLEALGEAGRLRFRPILMTTATTVLGLTPMALGLGEGSELRSPMALTVIGGLLTSTLLTLLIIPAVYSLVDRRP